MKRVLIGLSILLFATLIGITLHHFPGYILIAFHHWTVETTLLTGIILVVLFSIVAKGLLIGFWSAVHFPKEIREAVMKKRLHRLQQTQHQAIAAYGEGNWLKAENLMQKTLIEAPDPLLNYIILIKSAHEAGNYIHRDAYVSEAIQQLPKEKVVLQILQAQLCIDAAQWKWALEILCPLWKTTRQRLVLKYLVSVYEKKENWLELIALLKEIRRLNIFSKEGFFEFMTTVYTNALKKLLRQSKKVEILSFIHLVPAAVKKKPDWISVYADFLLQEKRMKEVEYILSKSLTKLFYEPLVILYSRLDADVAQTSVLESQLTTHPNNAVLLLALGIISQKKGLWGQAKRYYEESIQIAPSPRANLLLGLLLEQLGETTKACNLFRQGLITDLEYVAKLTQQD